MGYHQGCGNLTNISINFGKSQEQRSESQVDDSGLYKGLSFLSHIWEQDGEGNVWCPIYPLPEMVPHP